MGSMEYGEHERHDMPVAGGAGTSDPQRPGCDGVAVSAMAIAEGALLADIAAVFTLLTVYVPYVGAVFGPMIPATFAVLVVRRGLRVGTLSVLVAAFLLSVFMGLHFGLHETLIGSLGLAFGMAMCWRLRARVIIPVGSVISGMTLFLVGLVSVLLTGLPISSIAIELRNGWHTVTSIMATVTATVGLEQSWQRLVPGLDRAVSMAIRYWPLTMALLFVVGMVPIIALDYGIANILARALGLDVVPFPAGRTQALFLRSWLLLQRLGKLRRAGTRARGGPWDVASCAGDAQFSPADVGSGTQAVVESASDACQEERAGNRV